MKRLVVRTMWGKHPLRDLLECGHTYLHRSPVSDECRFRFCWQCKRSR